MADDENNGRLRSNQWIINIYEDVSMRNEQFPIFGKDDKHSSLIHLMKIKIKIAVLYRIHIQV